MQTWRFLYTSHSTIKKAVTKTGALREGKASKGHYIVIDGKDYSDCLRKAKNEAKFNERQLIGSRRIS